MKIVTLTISENGIVEIDMNGFNDGSCLKAMADFEFLGAKNENIKKKPQANIKPKNQDAIKQR